MSDESKFIYMLSGLNALQDDIKDVANDIWGNKAEQVLTVFETHDWNVVKALWGISYEDAVAAFDYLWPTREIG